MSTSKSKSPEGGLDRRSFFRAGTGAAVAAVGVAAVAPVETEAAETAAERAKSRYRETDHVKTYYRVNRY